MIPGEMIFDVQDFPRYDRDTLTRKVRAVIGDERIKNHDNLTNGEWRKVFALCAREYTFRRIRLLSARALHRMEARMADQEFRDRKYENPYSVLSARVRVLSALPIGHL